MKKKNFNLKEYEKHAQFTPPKMMPGQTPYTADELKALQNLYDGAVADDPGEAGEDVYLMEKRGEDIRLVVDQLTNSWEFFDSPEDLIKFLVSETTSFTGESLTKLINAVKRFYADDDFRHVALQGNNIMDWLRRVLG